MSFRAWTPELPKENLRDLSDSERRIYYAPGQLAAVWDLASIQRALDDVLPLKVIATEKAQWEMKEKLSWGAKDMRLFLRALSRGRYSHSEWCYAPKGDTPHACDIYLMGYSRTTGEENQYFQPWIYAKFGFIGPAYEKLAYFSAHPEGEYKGD